MSRIQEKSVFIKTENPKQVLHVVPREQSIAEIKAMFSNTRKIANLKMAYKSISAENRALLLIAAGMDPERCHYHFSHFERHEMAALCDGIKRINFINRRFSLAVGNISRLNITEQQ